MSLKNLISVTDLFSRSHRIVIKIGSSLLVDEFDGDKQGCLSPIKIKRLVKFVVRLCQEGRKVTVVSSGAVAASRSIISHSSNRNTTSIPEKQAWSAIGQIYLMEKYRRYFSRYGYEVGQILISKFSINHRTSYLNARNTIHELWRIGVIPIINENDPLATEEFRFGENDILGALTCGLVDADLYLILSHIDGVYKNFSQTKKEKGELYKEIKEFTPQFLAQFTSSSSTYGSGGILAKLEAARMAAKFGVPTLIKNGNQKKIYEHILDNCKGTLIYLKTIQTKGRTINAKKRWLLSHGNPRGIIYIDDGASIALLKGKSLLPRGVTNIDKSWNEGDICDVVNHRGQVIARGLCNYSHTDLEHIKGKKSQEILGILGRPSHTEIIHRDNLVFLESESQ